jgi:hypothetical protein
MTSFIGVTAVLLVIPTAASSLRANTAATGRVVEPHSDLLTAIFTAKHVLCR